MTAETKTHSDFGGSSAARWLRCPGSVALSKSVPPPKESAYAADGTFAHALAEVCLGEQQRNAFAYLNASLPFGKITDATRDLLFTEEHCTAVQTYLDAAFEEIDAAKDTEYYVEASFELPVPSAEPGEVFGTNDLLIYTPSRKRLSVWDYKHGAGVDVFPEQNEQLIFYATGALCAHPEWKVDDLELVIVQPRSRLSDEIGAVRRWTMDPLDILEFRARVDAAVREAKLLDISNDGPPATALHPGDHCRWCPAAAVCPARSAAFLDAAKLDYKDVADISASTLPDPKSLDLDHLGRVLLALDALADWSVQVRQYAEGLALQGLDIFGHKMVERIGRRKWTAAEEDIVDDITLMYGIPREQVMPPKLATITAVEAMIKGVVKDPAARKAALDRISLEFTVKDSSGLTLVPATDKRQAVNAIANDFGTVNTQGLGQ